jgi:hypothetical protein
MTIYEGYLVVTVKVPVTMKEAMAWEARDGSGVWYSPPPLGIPADPMRVYDIESRRMRYVLDAKYDRHQYPEAISGRTQVIVDKLGDTLGRAVAKDVVSALATEALLSDARRQEIQQRMETA